jgi:metal-responsive CopG/Arc/MetJ family transcriptional regulator
MASKMTFTLDDETAARIDRTAARLGMSKSGVVREAVREYAARTGMLSDEERRRMLEVFDEMTARIPRRPTAEVDREIKALRAARRTGGRRTPTDRP